MSLAILFHFLCAQHVSDINISIIRSLQLYLLNYDIGCFVLGSLCVGDLVLQPAIRTLLKPSRTKSPTHNEPRTKQPMW